MSSEFFFGDDVAVCFTADSINPSLAGLETCPLNTITYTVDKIDEEPWREKMGIITVQQLIQ